MKKRILSALFMLILVVVMLPAFVNKVSATSVSQADALAWAKSKIGVGLDYDGVYGNQCVDLIYYYYSYLGVSPVGGNACDYSSNTLPTGWTRITTNIVPQPGDIAVWKTYYNDGNYSTSWAGHIGIVARGNSSTFNIIHQNFNNYTTCVQSDNIPTAILECVIRPNFSGSTSGVTLSWEAHPDKQSVGSTNVVLANWCHMNVDGGAVTKVGIFLYDYSGKELAKKSESISLSGYTSVQIWYDVNDELGYTLAPGTTYKYKFMVVVSGETYYSPVYTFKTTGTHSHKYDSGTVTQKATCSAAGVKTYACTTCSKIRTESISKLSHDYAAATCTSAKKCKNCGATSGSALGHSYDSGKVTKAATCKENGVKTYTCSTCKGTRTETIAKTNDHKFGSWKNGVNNTHERVCSVCYVADVVEHTWNSGVVTKKATCKETGIKTYTCTTCGGTKSPTIAKLTTHTYTNACDSGCNVCGATRTVNHSYSSVWSKDKTNHWYVCSLCGARKSTAAHTPGAAATEDAAQTCTICGYVIQAALSHIHRYDNNLTMDVNGHWYACSGCEEKSGYTEHIYDNDCDADCADCGYHRQVNHVLAEEWMAGENTHYYVCTECGAKDNEAAHEPGPAATATTPQNCTICGCEIAPALGNDATEPTQEMNGSDATEPSVMPTQPATNEPTEDAAPGWVVAVVIAAAVIAVSCVAVVIVVLKKKS